MTILWIISVVVLVLALLGFWGSANPASVRSATTRSGHSLVSTLPPRDPSARADHPTPDLALVSNGW